MRHHQAQLHSILMDASQGRVRVECRDLDTARKFRYALARRRGPAGRIIIKLEGRFVVAEPANDPILSVEVS